MWQDSCDARFLCKRTRNAGAVGRESYKFMVTLNARLRVLLEKTHGIWKGFRDGRFSWKKIRNPGAVGRVSYEFTVTVNARRIWPEKTQGVWGGWYSARILHEKPQRFLRGWREWHLNLQSKWSPTAFYMRKHAQVHFTWENTKISPRSAGVTCKFTMEMKARRILHEKTQRFLRGWRRTEEGVYINREQIQRVRWQGTLCTLVWYSRYARAVQREKWYGAVGTLVRYGGTAQGYTVPNKRTKMLKVLTTNCPIFTTNFALVTTNFALFTTIFWVH